MKQTSAFKIDLTETGASGDFLCPRCGAIISPDDESEKVYSILGTKVSAHGLEELMICCNKCESQIHITGFALLQKHGLRGDQPKKEEKEEKVCYITHV